LILPPEVMMPEEKITGILERTDCNEENVMALATDKAISAATSAVNN
jgi:hypothetical protein